MPVKIPRKIGYKPVSVKELLIELKNIVSIMLDLAYYSVLYNDRRIAYEVLKLEDHVDTLWSLLMMQTSLAARGPKDAEEVLSIFRVVNALDKISDAAGDLALVVAQERKVPVALRKALLLSKEVVFALKIGKDSKVKGITIDELVDMIPAIDVLLLRRDNEWKFMPSSDEKIFENDIIVVRGGAASVRELAELFNDQEALSVLSSVLREKPSKEFQRIIRLKNLADIAIDLGFHSVVYRDKNVALEVLELEEFTDLERDKVIEELLVKHIKEPMEIMVFLRLVESLENIADAAAEMAAVVAMDLPVHEVLELAEEESREIVANVRISEKLSGKTLGELGLERLGAMVVAIKKGSQWYPLPSQETKLSRDDILILKLYSPGEDVVEKLLNEKGLMLEED